MELVYANCEREGRQGEAKVRKTSSYFYYLRSYAARQNVKARLDAWDPYKWAAPQFNDLPKAENEHDVIVIGSVISGIESVVIAGIHAANEIYKI